jgi:hypothetical protein
MQSSLEPFRTHNWNTGEWFPNAPAHTVADLRQGLARLDEEARLLAVLFLIERADADAAALLVEMTGDTDGQVAAAAADGLNSSRELPAWTAMVEAIPRRRNPFIRGQLYLAIARTGHREAVRAIRDLAHQEDDQEVRRDAEVAAILLDAPAERTKLDEWAKFIEMLRHATPAQALTLADRLQLIGDARLARGMQPWLANRAPVQRLGSDAQVRNLRMCDLACWTAHGLGVPFHMSSQTLTNFDVETLAAAEIALLAFPE